MLQMSRCAACFRATKNNQKLFHLPSLSFHCGFATVFALDDSFDVQFLGIGQKACSFSHKWAILALNPLLLWLTKEGSGWPVLGHLCIRAHDGCKTEGEQMNLIINSFKEQMKLNVMMIWITCRPLL